MKGISSTFHVLLEIMMIMREIVKSISSTFHGHIEIMLILRKGNETVASVSLPILLYDDDYFMFVNWK